MYSAQTIGLALSSDGEGMAEEQGETRGKSLGRTVMLTFASLCGFTPSLSKDAQEAAACCTLALRPMGSCFPKGSGPEQSGELSIWRPLHPLLPALRLNGFSISAGTGGIQAVSCSNFTWVWGDVLLWERRGVCMGGFASNNVYPWQSVVWWSEHRTGQ